jgi:photosystem II stability/assembly factor-like uncharacterized protein
MMNCDVYSQSKFFLNSPKLGPERIREIFFISDNVGYGIGTYGKLCKTINGGVNWNLIKPEGSVWDDVFLVKLFFVTEEIGYFVDGYGNFFKTSNAGRTIEEIFQFEVQPIETPTLHFFSENNGVLKFRNRGQNIYTTSDGGKSWQQIQNPPPGKGFEIIDEFTFIGNKENSIVKSEDGGETWVKIGTVPHTIKSIQFIDESVGFVYSYTSGSIGIEYFLSRTSDGGLSWETYRMPVPIGDRLYDVYFIDKDRGFGINSYPSTNIYETIDGGITWKKANYSFSSYLLTSMENVYFINPQIGYMVSSFGLFLKTVDGGITWNLAYESISPFTLNSICKITDEKQLIVGENGVCIIKETLGLTRVDIPTSADLIMARFADSLCGTIITEKGELLFSEDSGENWLIIDTLSNNVNEIKFNGDNGLISGDNGTVLFTEDKGKTWNDILIEGKINYHFKSSEIIGADTLLMLGFDTMSDDFEIYCSIVLFSSFDKGKNWNKKVITEFTDNDWPYDMYKLSSGNIIITTSNNILLSTNNGQSWDIIKTGNNISSKLIELKNKHIYGLKDNNDLFASADEGKTWDKIELFNVDSDHKTSDFLVTESDTIFVGPKGFIQSTDSLSCQLAQSKIHKTYLINLAKKSCKNYISPSGKYIWTKNGTYTDTIRNPIGCDSIISIELIITEVNTSISSLENDLISNATSASYQWLDCNNEHSIIQGEKNRFFTPSINGNYAVQVSQDGCVDTSYCYEYNLANNIENHFNENIKIYPNPTSGRINISFNRYQSERTVRLTNIYGEIIFQSKIEAIKEFDYTILQKEGIYLLELIDENGKKIVFKVLKI